MGLKSRIGSVLIPRLPVNRHVFNHLRLEANAIKVRFLHTWHPGYRLRIRKLRGFRNVKLNLGCGPFGEEGWINLDLFSYPSVTLPTDCRCRLPIDDGACLAIHVEHYFEHLTHEDEVARFLSECKRCLATDGVLRIIVPDAERFARAYAAEGWDEMEELAAVGTSIRTTFTTKMQALNHAMVQGYEHFGGYDFETLAHVLHEAGFSAIRRCRFKDGQIAGGCIDREQHKPYSLYVEATKKF